MDLTFDPFIGKPVRKDLKPVRIGRKVFNFLCLGKLQTVCVWGGCFQVEYVEGTALVLGFEDPMVRTDDTPVKRCLQTRWPYIELLWTTDRSPSLN